MRLAPTFCLILTALAANLRCGGKGSTADAGNTGVSCTGQQAVCPDHPFAACVEVQDSLGHCVDWTMVGATPCPVGPDSDCPTTLPSASFPGAAAGLSTTAVCVKAADLQYSNTSGNGTPGYCAAIEAFTDALATATCTPNPCGASGYCSFLHTAAGTSVVSCMWPI
jgi:hypothetical protein